MNILNFISIHPLLSVIIIVVIYLFFRFYIKPKYIDKQLKKQEISKEEIKDDGKETIGKRISRGFGIMMNKINNSTIVKNIKKEQEEAWKETTNEKSIAQPKDPYQWSTDLSVFTKK